MVELVQIIGWLVGSVLLLALGLIAGGLAESRHLRDLARRERELAAVLVTDLRSFAPDLDASRHAALVVGEAVIATDYLKTFLARLRNLFGGEVRSYVSMANRARREALLRMLAEARAAGFDAVCNVRLDTADIGADVNRGGRGMSMAAVIASGTAYRRGVPAGHPFR